MTRRFLGLIFSLLSKSLPVKFAHMNQKLTIPQLRVGENEWISLEEVFKRVRFIKPKHNVSRNNEVRDSPIETL